MYSYLVKYWFIEKNNIAETQENRQHVSNKEKDWFECILTRSVYQGQLSFKGKLVCKKCNKELKIGDLC